MAGSLRAYQGLPDIDYPLHDKVIVVTRCGRIYLGRKKINFSTVFAGQAVGTSLGKKSFILYRKFAGRPERITIGPFVDLSIDQARGRAEQLNADIAMGENPAARKLRVALAKIAGWNQQNKTCKNLGMN